MLKCGKYFYIARFLLAETGQLPQCDECVSSVCVQTVSVMWSISKPNTDANVTEAVTSYGFFKTA